MSTSVTSAPAGPFDGAVWLLVFHHISPEDCKIALDGMRQRMKRESPLVLAHVSFPLSEPEYSSWIDRHVEFAARPDMDAVSLKAAKKSIRLKTFIRSPEDEVADLERSGFTDIVQFYQAISFRGWVAHA